MENPYRLSLLGAEVDVVTPDFVMDFVTKHVASRQRTVVANHNLHSLYLYKKQAEMRDFYAEADLIEIDSVPLIGWAMALGLKVSRKHRCTYLDFRDQFWKLVQKKGWRVAHVGGRAKDNVTARCNLYARYPGIHLDMHPGYFDVDGQDNEDLIEDLRAERPDVLLVGMGMPRQELWILKNLRRLPHCVILPVGAAFDYEAGAMYAPPRWTGQVGVEWLVRFFHEPKRLWSRYFVEPWHLIPQFLGDIATLMTGQSFHSLHPSHDIMEEAFLIDVDLPENFNLAPWHRPQALSGAGNALPPARLLDLALAQVIAGRRRAS